MTVTILKGDCREVLRELPAESVHCVVTSPPYFGLRDYGVAGQIGLEPSPEAFVGELVAVFRDVRRVLRVDGTLWLNLGDSYANDGKWGGHTGGKHVKALHCSPIGRMKRYTGLKPKDLCGIPWAVAFALRDDGWWLRQDIIWSKPNSMPESTEDRCTKAHEYLFLFAKNGGDPLLWRHRDSRTWVDQKPPPDYVWRHRDTKQETREPQTGAGWTRINLWGGRDYYYDADAIAEPAVKAGEVLHSYATGAKDRQDVSETNDRRTRIGLANWNQAQPDTRNKRSVWEVTTAPYADAHFATFPPALIKPCILAGCPQGGTVLDPFGGAGTTAMVADRLGRDTILIELNPEYAAMAERRIKNDAGMFADVTPSR